MSEIQEEIQVDFVRTYLELMERALINPDATVSMADAREVVEQVRSRNRFERMMYAFMMVVADRSDDQEIRVVLSEPMLDFVRTVHQKHQRAKLYKGGKCPELLGLPIVVKDVGVPRMEQIWKVVHTIQGSDGGWYETRRHVDGYLDIRKVEKP